VSRYEVEPERPVSGSCSDATGVPVVASVTRNVAGFHPVLAFVTVDRVVASASVKV
jgi:hypothetical protein